MYQLRSQSNESETLNGPRSNFGRGGKKVVPQLHSWILERKQSKTKYKLVIKRWSYKCFERCKNGTAKCKSNEVCETFKHDFFIFPVCL